MKPTALLTVALSMLVSTVAIAQEPTDKASLEEGLRDAFAARDLPTVIGRAEALLKLDPQHPEALFDIGYALHSQGEYRAALVYHERGAAVASIAPPCAYNAACAHALLGEPDAAFKWLGKALDAGFGDLRQFESDPDLSSLRADPRMAALRQRITPKATMPTVVLSQTMDRAGTRVAAFGQDGARGQVSIEYGPAAWKEDYTDHVESGKADGQRWRLGKDAWTHLASDVPFTLANTSFAAGDYYLVLERTGGKYLLTLIPVADVRKLQLDANWARDSTTGTSIEMRYANGDTPATRLSIRLATSSQQSTAGDLTIHFGPHVLQAPFAMQI